MARKYYYFLASLPALFLGQKLPMTIEEYLDRCQSALSPEDAEAVHLAVYEDPLAKSGVAARWSQMRHDFKNELAYERAMRAGKDPLKYIRGQRSMDSFLRDIVLQSLNTQDPLESQKLFDYRMWELLDEMESGHYFDCENAVIYGLRLNILKRMEDITSYRGKEIFERYMNSDHLSAVYAAVKE